MSDPRLNPVVAERALKQHEDQLELLHAITKELAAAGDLASALQTLLRRVCEKTGWVLGQAWLPNQTGTALECGPAWPADGGELQAFRAASKKSHFVPGIGLPGRVWLSRQFSWIDDVTADPNFPRAASARAAGLMTGVGIPLVSGDKVIAVLEFFMRESREESEQLLNFIA